MKKFFGALAVSAALVGSSYAANPFNDVPRGHWAYDAIDKVVDAGMMKGYKNGMFEGQSTVNRYEMAIIISRLLDKMEGKTIGSDVRRTMDRLGEEFMDELDLIGARLTALENAFHEHVTEVNNKPMGSHDGFTFSGDTRLRMLSRSVDFTNPSFKDSDTDLEHRTYLNVAKKFDRGSAHVSLRHDGTFGDHGLVANDTDGSGEFSVSEAYVNVKVNDDSFVLAGRLRPGFGTHRVLSAQNNWAQTPRTFDGLLFGSKASDFDYNVFSIKVSNAGVALAAPAAGNDIEVHGLNLDFADVFDGKLHAFYYAAPGFTGLGSSLDVYGFDWTLDKGDWHYNLEYAKNAGDNGGVGAANKSYDGDLLNLGVFYDLDKDSKLGVRYEANSGDDDNGVNATNKTFMAIAPKRHMFRGNMDIFAEGNIEDLSVYYSKKMNDRNKLKLAYHMFTLENASTAKGFANLGTGAVLAPKFLTGTTKYDDDLGTEIDINWVHKLSKDIKVDLGYSIFSAGDYFTNGQGPAYVAPDSTFAYISTAIKF